MDVTDTLPETIMENPESIGDPEETPEDIRSTSNENITEPETEPKADFITSLLEDSFNEQCASADNMLIGECDEPVSGLELSLLDEKPKSPNFFSIDIQSPGESEPLKESMDVDGEIDTAKEKDVETSIITTSKEVTAESDVQQTPQEVIRSPDKTTSSEMQDVPVTMTENVLQPSTDKANVCELENPPQATVPADDNIHQPTEIILTDDEIETTELEKPPKEITDVTVTDKEANVQQLPTEIILSDDDETDVFEVGKPSQEITGAPDKETNLQQVPTEIILTDDEEAEPSEFETPPQEIEAITVEDDDDHTRSDIVFTNEEAMVADNGTDKDESAVKETSNADILTNLPEIISCISESETNVVDSITSEDIPTSRKEGEADVDSMEVQESDTLKVSAESEKRSELLTKDSVSDTDNIQGDSLNKETNDAVTSDGPSAPMEIEPTVSEDVEKSVTTGNVDTEEVDDSDPVFVSTGSEKNSTTEKTCSATQDDENFQANQPQEDPIGSDDLIAVTLDEDAEPDATIEDQVVDIEQGASEEMCIIPDTERVISQAEKDAVASMVPLRDPTESELFSNDPSSEATSAESAADKSSNPENYVVSRCTDENVNSCMQCCLPRKSKYSILHQKVMTYICDDGCLNNFKRRHTDKIIMNTEGDLRVKKLTSGVNNDNMVVKVKFCRKCAECQKELELSDVHLSWQTMEFCTELCLSKYQKRVGSKCSNCNTIVRTNCLGKYCVRFGYNIRQFCSSVCLEEFKKGLKVCSYCQKDMSTGGGDGFLAPVGDKGQFKDFCTQSCMEKYDIMSNNQSNHSSKSGNMCSVCLKEKPTTIEFEHDNKMNFFCGEPCFVAFKFVNNIAPGKCNMCKKYFDNKILEENSMFYDNALLSFCAKSCQNIYIIGHRKIVPCSWCKVKKYNFDMINRLSSSGASLLMCSLNCLNLYQVSINAVQSKKKNCDHCQKSYKPLYHLTMSDASIRNFCSYPCVMAFQNQFSKTPITLNEPEDDQRTLPVPTSGPKKTKRLLKSKKKESVPAVPTVPTIPVISSVQSLATTNGPSTSPPSGHRTKNSTTTTRPPSPPVIKTKILRQVIIKPTPIPPHRNVGTLCKINTKSKEVTAKPTTCDAEVQTDEIKEKTSIIPIPVPIHVPAPMWMYSMPLPVPFPFPLPVPVPIFIPTTRNSAMGIMKEIKKIQVKIPTDPFEAELLMMAEMVAGDKKEEHTESESEEEDTAAPPPEEPTYSPEPVDPNNSFGDDMLQMALKMATELDEPAVDLEGALTVNTITASQEEAAPAPVQAPEQSPPIPMTERQSNRGRKRMGRPPKAAPITSKRGRRTSMQVDIPAITPPPPTPPQEPVEKPDANMCLKFTFGVNAWKQWVTTKNAELEKTSRRVKLFKPEILQLTADELNYSLCLFVKEVRKPNGQEYAPDTIYYLCLGIQQYLFENARIDNIFCDSYYEKFTDCLDEVAKKFSVLYNDSHYIVTRVEEEHLWESKQLGAHSPHVLLSTLMFFNTKHFNLTTVDEHMQLSFSHIMKHWKRNPNQPGAAKTPGSRNVLLRFYPPQVSTTDTPPRKKKVYEQQENEDNPLRCPVKLYEFYLSKCPESVKTRNDVFYLLPERSCVPDSPVWYSTMPLPRAALEKMLHRIKMVKEINVALLTS